MSDRISVSSADFIRNIGQWQNEALKRPVVITHHGRDRLVLAAAEKFEMSNGASADELVALRAKLAIFSDDLVDGYASFSGDRRVRRANAAAEALFGIARDDMVGRSIPGVFPEPLASNLDYHVERVIRSNEMARFEVAVGERKLIVSVFPAEKGGAVVIFHNVSKEHELRRRLEELSALSRALRECAQASSFTLTAGALIEGVDQKLSVWTGFDTSELTGRSAINLFPVPKRAEIAEFIHASLRDGRSASITTRLARKGGGEIAGVFSIAPTIADAVVRGAVAVFIASPTLDENRNAA